MSDAQQPDPHQQPTEPYQQPQPYGQQPTEPYQQPQPHPTQPYGQQPYPTQPYGQQPPPQYGQQPYPTQPYAPNYAAPASPRGLSIASFVLGLVNLVFWFSVLLPILGLILGFIGLRQEPAGRGFAITGIILNGLLSLGAVIVIVIIVLSFIGVIGALPFLFGSIATSGVPA